ncbi:MAG: hypothetical protein M5U28_39850 [Sandaracinaceae bacterium]|nr:hypothetical protein [Sandaracinaceae bacterium]
MTARLAPLGSMLLALLLCACDGGGGDPDAGRDAGSPGDAGSAEEDAGADAGGMCTEFTPEYCPRTYPMVPIPMRDICEVFADVFCRANGRCCTRPDEIYASFAACISDQVARCMNPSQTYEFPEALAAGALDYNSAAMGEQRAILGMMSDACTPIRFGDAILSAMTGRVAFGDACTASPECVAGYDCREGSCQLELGLGDGCASHAECEAAGLFCDGGTCAMRRAIGASCTDDEECESRVCVDGACEDANGGAFYCVRQGEPGRAFER